MTNIADINVAVIPTSNPLAGCRLSLVLLSLSLTLVTALQQPASKAPFMLKYSVLLMTESDFDS